MNRIVVAIAVGAIVIGLSIVVAAALWPLDSEPQVAQTPLEDKQRQDQQYKQRQDAEKSRASEASDAARAQAEDDARRRAAELLRQQSEDANRQRQLDDINKRFRSDQPQPQRP